MEAYCPAPPQSLAQSPASSRSLALDRLHNLARINVRGARRMRAAAHSAGDRVLQSRLEQFAAQREAQARELRAFDPQTGEARTSLSEDEHVLIAAMPVADDLTQRAALLDEVERGEAAACRAYQRAIKAQPVADELNALFARHLEQTRQAHRVVADLRDLLLEI